MRLHERVAKGVPLPLSGDECRSWVGHQVMLARVPHHQTTAIGRPSPPAAPGPRRLPCTSRPHQVAPLVPGQGVAYPVRSVACAWHNRQPLQLSAEKALHGPCPRMRATGCPLGQSPKTPRVFGGANRRISAADDYFHSLLRKCRPGTVTQQMLHAPVMLRHVPISKQDSHAGID